MTILTLPVVRQTVLPNAEGAVGYLKRVQKDQLGAGLVLRKQSLADAVAALGGAQGLTPPDSFRDFQFNLPIYVGVTTPRATSEVPHWHPDQTELYVVIDGQAELVAKHRWEEDGWVTHSVGAGDLVIVREQVCHWWRWLSATGFAHVIKSPQRPGVGRFPAGKQTCDGGGKPGQACPHFGNGCVMPHTWAGVEFPGG